MSKPALPSPPSRRSTSRRSAIRRRGAAVAVVGATIVTLAPEGAGVAGGQEVEAGPVIQGVTISADRSRARVALACAADGPACDITVSGRATVNGSGSALVSTTRSPGLYFGALVDAVPPSKRTFADGGAFARLEKTAGKGLSLVHWGQPWRHRRKWVGFPGRYMENVRRHGAIPVIDWGAWEVDSGVSQPRFRSRVVASGRYDAHIRRWAKAAKAWGHPFMLRFDHEMNGWWYPWGQGLTSRGRIANGNRPGDFIAAWRHVHDVFERVGADNVTWMWSPNFMAVGGRYPALASMYPGKSYVDWVGLSAYNRDRLWLSPDEMLTGRGTRYLQNSYAAVKAIAPRKPIMLAETASVEDRRRPGRKAAWIRDLVSRQIPQHFRQIKGFMWYDKADAGFRTLPVASSRASSRAFAGAVGSSRYASNDFSDLKGKKVRALKPQLERSVRLHLEPGATGTVTMVITPKTAARMRRRTGEVSVTASFPGTPERSTTLTTEVPKP